VYELGDPSKSTHSTANYNLRISDTCVKLRPTFNIWHSILQKPIPRDVQIKCKKYWTTVINLRAEAIVRCISDAIFLLPVTCSSSPNVHSLSQWRILLFVRTTSYVIITISLQKHSSPGTAVLTDYKRRDISTSSWAQNAALCAQPEVEIKKRSVCRKRCDSYSINIWWT